MKNEIKEKVDFFCKEILGEEIEIYTLGGAGSDRRYFRIKKKDGETFIATFGENINENITFISLDRLFIMEGIQVPEIIAVNENEDVYIQEDLGDISLLSQLSSESGIDLGKRALLQLIKLQLIPEDKWRDLLFSSPFSERLIMWDLNYYKYDFLKPAAIEFDEDRLQDDFDRLCEKLNNYDRALTGLMYRDFQSRNILFKNNRLYFIDFQGARKGPIVYDAVSFCWQAKAPFTYEQREKLLDFYCEKLSESLNFEVKEIKDYAQILTLFRALQVMGAYGFRGLIEKKAHFIESIPFGIKNLAYLKKKGYLREYPEIGKTIDRLEKSRLLVKSENINLHIKIFSFSYKKGYPEDLSGNGGGFMFDCRGLPNPGRYPHYKHVTGRDEEVISFFHDYPEVDEFIANAFKIVSPTIRRYIERGFNSLQIGFGCTGGQHRSVYCAERIAALIFKKYPEAVIELYHREQNITESFKQD